MNRLAPRLLWCVPTVFGLGVTALAVTWTLFYIYYPDGFIGTLPTISETIAYAPGSYAFQLCMAVVTPSIAVTWWLNYHTTKQQLWRDGVRPGYRLGNAHRLNFAACIIGILAGALLAGLSIFRLHDGTLSHHLHIWLSAGFYVTQVLAFILDTICAWMRRTVDETQMHSLRLRLWVSGITLGGSLLFLFLFFARHIFADAYMAQLVYVTCEYIISAVCFSYPMAAYPEIRAYLAVANAPIPAE